MMGADGPVNGWLELGGVVPFSIAADTGKLRPVADEVARRAVLGLVQRFEDAFPDIEFDVRWPSASLNAQAYRRADRRCVLLQGGLVRHVALGQEGLAVAIAHEVGHHEGGAPAHRFY